MRAPVCHAVRPDTCPGKPTWRVEHGCELANRLFRDACSRTETRSRRRVTVRTPARTQLHAGFARPAARQRGEQRELGGHDGDGGRFLNTFGVIVARTPDKLWTNWSIARIMVVDGKRMTGIVAPTQRSSQRVQRCLPGSLLAVAWQSGLEGVTSYPR